MSESSKDCLQCRLTGGGALIMAGIYVSYHGKKLKMPYRYYMGAIGYGLGALGVCRIFNLPPFRHQKRHDEKKKLDGNDENGYIVGKFPSKF